MAGEQVGAERGAAGLDAALGTTRLEAEGETREDGGGGRALAGGAQADGKAVSWDVG